MIDTQHSQTGEDFCSQMLQGKTHSEKKFVFMDAAA